MMKPYMTANQAWTGNLAGGYTVPSRLPIRQVQEVPPHTHTHTQAHVHIHTHTHRKRDKLANITKTEVYKYRGKDASRYTNTKKQYSDTINFNPQSFNNTWI